MIKLTKINKNQLLYLIFLLTLVSLAKNQTLEIPSNLKNEINVENRIKSISSFIKDQTSNVVFEPQIPKFQRPIISYQNQKKNKAETYKGKTFVNTTQGNSNSAQFYISFTIDTQNCERKYCFYGWVDNYTIKGQGTVQGYPKGTEQIKPIFRFQTNSKNDYIIIRNPDLEQAFVNIIEISCQFYQPTIKPSPTISRDFLKASLSSLLDESNQYDFIPQSQYQRLKPLNTDEYQSLLFMNPKKNVDISNIQTKNSQTNQAKIDATSNEFKVAATSEKLLLKDISVKKSIISQKITVDKNYNIQNRQRVINLHIKSDSFADEKQPISFVFDISIQFEKSGDQDINKYNLQNYINSFSARAQKIVFSNIDIQQKRNSNNGIFTNQQLHINNGMNMKQDTLLKSKPEIKVTNYDKIFTNCISSAKVQTKLKSSTTLDKIQQNVIPPSRRLLVQKPAFIYEKILFQKTVLGKQIKVSIKVQTFIIDNKNVRSVGTFIYELFGKVQTVQAFNYIKDISLTWSFSFPIQGNWDFNIYIALPSPVSFIGINFGFTVYFSVIVDIYGRGNPIVNCVYNFDIDAYVGTQVAIDATAALRLALIEGGVYIKGTLVRLSTDPKLSVALDISANSITTHITWYLYIKAFQFQWGFFYRYWRLWHGWTERRIIASWSIGSGHTQTYLILKR